MTRAEFIQREVLTLSNRGEPRDECQEVAAFLRFLGLDSVALRIEAGEHRTAYREVPV